MKLATMLRRCTLPTFAAAALAVPAFADLVYHNLSGGSLTQDWSNTGLITVNNDWSGVPSITGYGGNDLTTATGVNPQTILADGSATPVFVLANQTNPNTLTTGGIAEFDTLANPTIAMQGSGTSDVPHIVIRINSSTCTGVRIQYNLRDVDGAVDNAVQPIALQYRVGGAGPYTDVPAGFVADASTGPSLATLVTPVSVSIGAWDNQAQLEIRIMTTNAVGSDEWIGIDDIIVSATSCGVTQIPAGCCFDAAQICSLELEEDCTNAGGRYLGDNTSCVNNACAFPLGACCHGTTCSIDSPLPCADSSGTYQGDNSICTPNPCLPCSTITQAKAAASNTTLKVCNVIVTSTTDLVDAPTSKNLTVQNNDGGMTLFGANGVIDALLAGVAPGDSIDIQGSTTSFNGLFEVSNPLLVVNHGPVGVPTPVVTTSADLADGSAVAEARESTLVVVHCVTFVAAGNFAGLTNYTVNDADNNPIIVRVSTTGQDLVGTAIPTGPVDIVGVVGQNDAAAPFDAGYQLLVRTLADITPSTHCPPPCLHGDGDCDGLVNNFDIDKFVAGILNDFDQYTAIGGTPACWDLRSCWGDINCDLAFNNFDIDSFVSCVLAAPLPGEPCPCPAP